MRYTKEQALRLTDRINAVAQRMIDSDHPAANPGMVLAIVQHLLKDQPAKVNVTDSKGSTQRLNVLTLKDYLWFLRAQEDWQAFDNIMSRYFRRIYAYSSRRAEVREDDLCAEAGEYVFCESMHPVGIVREDAGLDERPAVTPIMRYGERVKDVDDLIGPAHGRCPYCGGPAQPPRSVAWQMIDGIV